MFEISETWSKVIKEKNKRKWKMINTNKINY